MQYAPKGDLYNVRLGLDRSSKREESEEISTLRQKFGRRLENFLALWIIYTHIVSFIEMSKLSTSSWITRRNFM